MVKKRLVGVITVKDGWAVQSLAYTRYLPVGRPECLAENLERWGADEILVMCIDRTRKGFGPDLALLKRLSSLGLSTPLTFGGGIHTLEQASAVIQSGAERLCVDSALRADNQEIRLMAELLGAQALIGAMPLHREGQQLWWYDYLMKESSLLRDTHLSLFSERLISEALVIDWRHEGQRNGFDMDLVTEFPFKEVPLITFGGLSEPAQLTSLLSLPNVSAVAVGNFLNYSEHAVQNLKGQLIKTPLRPAVFKSSMNPAI